MRANRRIKILETLPDTVKDAIARANELLTQSNTLTPDWNHTPLLPKLWSNVVTFALPTTDPSKPLGVPIATEHLVLAHFWQAETHGLTSLSQCKVYTVAEACQHPRGWYKTGHAWGFGEVSLKELDRILNHFGVWYADGDQLSLYPGNFPEVDIS